MKRITSKNRRKAIKQNSHFRKEQETFNGDFVGIDKKKIELFIPDRQMRLNYIRELIRSF